MSRNHLPLRYSGRWMSIVDDRILEYLSENDPAGPTKMQQEGRIPYTPEYVAERCRELRDRGFLQALGNGVYKITERGTAYLAGDFDANELETK